MCWCVLAVCSYSVAIGEEKSRFAAILILLVSLLRSFYWLSIDSLGRGKRDDAPWSPPWYHSVSKALTYYTICPKLVSYKDNLRLGPAWSYLSSWKLLSGRNLDQMFFYASRIRFFSFVPLTIIASSRVRGGLVEKSWFFQMAPIPLPSVSICSTRYQYDALKVLSKKLTRTYLLGASNIEIFCAN
jgi:hypothetical protein